MNKWYVPDAYYPDSANGKYVSHEAVCFLNESKTDAAAVMTLYFEDREKMTGFTVKIPAERTVHCRLDKIRNSEGKPVPRDTPYAIVIESEADLTLQYTRLDTTQAELALMTTRI